jgi:hypothetical protein
MAEGALAVLRCARCGEDHASVAVRPLDRPMAPPEAAPLAWTHWAPCPTNGQPIMLAWVAPGVVEGDLVNSEVEAGAARPGTAT